MKLTRKKKQTKIKRFYIKLINAIKIAYFAFNNPRVFQIENFKMLTHLLKHILDVAIEKKPKMAKIGIIIGSNNDESTVAVWAGSGIGADPYERIQELKHENELLTIQLAELIKNNHELHTKKETDCNK